MQNSEVRSRIASRDAAFRVINRLTAGLALASVAGVGGLAYVSAATIPGSSTSASSSAATATATASVASSIASVVSSAATSASSSAGTSSSTSSSSASGLKSGSASSSSGTPVAVSGGSS